MPDAFSIDAANSRVNYQDRVASYTGPTPGVPPPVPGVAVPPPGVSGPTPAVTEIPPGAGRIGAGTAPGPSVPTVAQVLAGQPIVQTPTLPPQQPGAPPAPLTHVDIANNLVGRVSEGLRSLLGMPAAAAAQPKQPSAEFLATQARFPAQPAAPNIFQLRKSTQIASSARNAY